MEWIKPGTNIDFMKAARLWVPLSGLFVVLSIGLVGLQGFDAGIDFMGGTKVIAEFRNDAGVERGVIKKVVDDLVTSQTGETGTQVEVQDFDVGGTAGSETVKYQIFTELPSLLTPLKKLELAKLLEAHFGVGTTVDTPFEAGDKFYITLPDKWSLIAAREELQKVFQSSGHRNITVRSDKEERVLTELYREKDLLLSAKDDEVKAEAMKVEEEARKKIARLVDNRFTVEVQAVRTQVTDALKSRFGEGFVDVLSTASVSPSVGKELFQTGMLALLYAIIGILIYISIRFDMKFAPGAIACIIHDVIIVLGLIVLLQIKFTLPIIAAIMALIGYDINDTIVVYDRVRENLQKGKGGHLPKVINLSINETLARTVITSLTTEMVLASIFLLGGGTIKDFALVLFVGVILGTYSSIFIASPLTIYLDRVFRKRAAERG
ncbi:MAG: protein translocase subunit SecF [Deltaproteobacteria bacterium]|nr:protein translocase subunit SecF [Deltaproteobacteria bacterium]